MATNYLKWINISLATLVVFAISFFSFSSLALADTSNITNYRKDYSGNFASADESAIIVSMPDGSSVDWVLEIDYGHDFRYDNLLLNFRPNPKSTFLGDLTLDISSIVNVFPTIYLDLPVASLDIDGNLVYNNNSEIVGVLAGQPYYDLNNLGDNNLDYYLFNNVNNHAFSGGGCVAVTNNSGNDLTSYVGLKFNFEDYLAPNGLIFTGSYDDVWDENPYYFICYIFQTLSYLYDNHITFDCYMTCVFADGFAHLDTEEYKLYKETLENAISGGLTDTNNKLDDLLNEGSGQFDDTKDLMQNASDKAEQGNQDIQNNAPKPDINDTVNDTSDVIDDALSGESFDKVSDLLSAIFANTLISTILLISVAVGAVKYIFFGKG